MGEISFGDLMIGVFVLEDITFGELRTGCIVTEVIPFEGTLF